MGEKLRIGGRALGAAALLLVLVLAFAGEGGARVTDATAITVSIAATASPASSLEGDNAIGSGSNNYLNFGLTLSVAATGNITVEYSSSEGPDGSTVISAGQTSATISVPINGNTTPEADRTLTVNLTSATSDDPTDDAVSLGDTTGTGTIVDDDWRISGIATTPSNATASENGGTIDFQVSLNAPAVSGHSVSVDYAVAGGSEYTVTSPAGQSSGTLTFAPGSSTADVQVEGVNNNTYDPNEQFTVTFSNPQGASFSGGGGSEQATGTITEYNLPPVVGINNCGSNGTVNAGDVATFAIGLAGVATTLPASVDYTTVDDSTVPGDYTPVSGTATIQPGDREYDLTVQTLVNPPAGDRSFHVELSNPQNVRIGGNGATCTIHSTAAGGGSGSQPSVQVTGPAPVVEPASGSTPVSVALTLTPPASQSSSPTATTVHWQTEDGTAKAPADYTAASGDVTWPAGTSGPNPTPITVTINANPATTQPVSFKVAFTSSDATFTGGSSATITIVPAGTTVPLLSIGNASGPKHGGSIPVTVSLAPAATGVVTVAYATADGTDANAAKAGVNYTAASGTLTFQPGDTSKTIPIAIIPNSTVEPNRDFTVNLSNATGASIATATATVTILNDVGTTTLPPLIPTKSPGMLQHPIALPQKQPLQKGTHQVLVQIVTGESRVNAKGSASFKVTCPGVVLRQCIGTIAFDVRVPAKVPKGSKAKPKLTTLRVANGSFKLFYGSSGLVPVKLTPAGLKLLESVKRMRVKATVAATDASGAKGVTAWIVSLEAPVVKTVAKKTTKPAAKKPTTKK